MGDAYVDPQYPRSEVTGRIIAAAMKVHRGLGPGFQELFYQRALALELPEHGLEFNREVEIEVYYRSVRVDKKRVDFVIEGVFVELKATSELQEAHFVQALSYLKASGYPLGLLLNFGAARLQIKRLAN